MLNSNSFSDTQQQWKLACSTPAQEDATKAPN